MQQASGVLHIRPSDLEFGGQFQASLSESASNIFVQEVKAGTADESRMSWNFRSPSQNLLCSPHMTATFQVKLKCPYKLSKADQIGPLLGCYDANDPTAAVHAGNGTGPFGLSNIGAEVHGAATSGLRQGYRYRPMLAFSEGNAFHECL